MSSRPQRYWSFSEDGPARHPRWHIRPADEDWCWYTRPQFIRGISIAKETWPSPPPVFTYKVAEIFEDMPWPCFSVEIVSDRLRLFLEEHAPGAAEYHPVRFQGPRSEHIPGPYWCMNWLRRFDCLDEDMSMDEDEDGRRFVQVPVIDPTRIPDDGVLGLLGGYEVYKLIRNDLKLKIQKAGFLGPQFYRIAHNNGVGLVPFRKVGTDEVVGGPLPQPAEPRPRKRLNRRGKRAGHDPSKE